MNPWSKLGVATYPPRFPLVGQNRVYNALHRFKQTFSQDEELCGFFVLIGDWGLGKTRLGYELFAETAGHVDEWLLGEEYVLPSTNRRVLEPQLAEGILPLFIDYKSALGPGLGADTWVAKVAGEALALLWERPKDLRVSADLLDDMVAVLKAKGVDLAAVRAAFEGGYEWGDRLDAAMAVLRAHGIRALWIVVDEVETPSDLRRSPDYQMGTEIDEEELVMISQVIKEARYREAHPYANFLLLCSLGMNPVLNIGPNRRRAELVTLSPNHIPDVLTFRDHLQKAGIAVDYPAGTLEGVFIATNRNFGWFNKVMSSIHASWEAHRAAGHSVPPAWELIKEYALSEARAAEVFDLAILRAMDDAPAIKDRLIFGQLPVEIGPEMDEDMAAALLAAQVPGVGAAFARLSQVHINENTLGNELMRPEYGFRKVDRPGDDYANAYTELSLSGVLSALRAFSVAVSDGDFVIYDDIDQFAEQLVTLYPHDRLDENKSIGRAAEPLHRIFMQYVVPGRRYLGVSYKLLKKIDVKMSVESEAIAFFHDNALNERLEAYATEQKASSKKRMEAVCRGMAKALDDSPRELRLAASVDGVCTVSFESDFASPHFEGLAVTRNGRVTVAFVEDVDRAAQELASMLGRASESAHPIIVLFDPEGDVEHFDAQVAHQPLLKRSAIVRRLTRFEADFLIKYSGRDQIFESSVPLSRHALSTLGALRQDLAARFRDWKQALDQAGYLLRPIWYKPVSGREDFFQGYRYLLAKGETADALDPAECAIPGWNDVSLNNFRTAAKRNIEPGRGYTSRCLDILHSEPIEPQVPLSLVRVLQEMRAQAGEDSLAKRFFYAVRDSETKEKPITQAIAMLEALGVAYSPSRGQYKAVSKAWLDEWRTRVSSWLDTAAEEMIGEIQDIFPQQADQLRKGFRATARQHLREAEAIAARIDFSFLGRDEPDIQAFVAMVSGILEFETALLKICPRDPQQGSTFSEELIKTYQDKYQSLSFWDKVHFLRWLRNKFATRRDEVVREIGEQIADVSHYASVTGGYAFPIAPLTLPLKAIEAELQAALTGVSTTVRGHLDLADCPLSIQHYLYQFDYYSAWVRLKKLADLASREASQGLWQRFRQQYDLWDGAARQFAKASDAWGHLRAFLEGAPSSAWSGSESLKRMYQDCCDQMDGGLKHDIDSCIPSHSTLQLLDRLCEEVAASVPHHNELLPRILAFHEKVRQRLLGLIDTKRLQALNHLLTALGQDAVHPPECQATYLATKTAYEAFNAQVATRGRACLEGQHKLTNWDLWVEIYCALESGQYTKKPEHEPNLSELEQMGLIKTKIVLA